LVNRSTTLWGALSYSVLRMDVYAFGAEQAIATRQIPASEQLV
jgi:hypothetical protein